MKILLICTHGASTSMLVKKMQDEARKQKIDVTIAASGMYDAKSELDKWDVILLGPQVKHLIKQVKMLCKDTPNKPIDVISPILYGRIDGKGTLELAINLYNKETEKK